ncbi:DinB family protein [Xanthobacter sp. DSM 24535]|uniref:DinB family protein n=1 Tax=Roseixanthobacter psychrophilus TaxID=3119917 RepID=UPI0037288CDD
MVSLRSYTALAGYNAWANLRLYDAAARLDDGAYRAGRGAFFGSVHGTLNHLLVTDRIWMDRFTLSGAPQPALDTILFSTLADLRTARVEEDARIATYVAGLTPAALEADISYANSSGRRFAQTLTSALDHLFNHQTHHRGQVHCLLTMIGGREAAPSLDLIAYQRELPAD